MKLIKGLVKHPLVSGPIFGGAGNAAVWDVGNLSDNEGWRSIPGIGTIADLVEGRMSPVRRNNLILNSIIGAAAGTSGAAGLKQLSKGNTALGTPLAGLGLTGFLATPYKDVAQTATNFLDKNRQVGQDIAETINKQVEGADTRSKLTNWLLGGALGLGGAGLLYSMLKKDKPEKAKMLVKLPGDPEDPDSDVMLEVPVTAGRIKPEVMQGIRKSLRKQTAKNIRSQQRKRDLETGKLIPYNEWMARYGDEEENFRKYASTSVLTKEAEGREWAEGLGSLLAPAIGGLAAGYATNRTTGDLKKSVFAGAGAAIVPMILGSLLGNAANKNTAVQQEEHDAEAPFLEYILPGYAQYQSARRLRVPSQEGMEDEDELDTDDDLDYEDELDKYAAQAAPSSMQPPMGQMPPSPAPVASPVAPPAGGGIIGARPDMLAGASSVTAETNKAPGTTVNSSKHLRQAADNLANWLKQYNVRKG